MGSRIDEPVSMEVRGEQVIVEMVRPRDARVVANYWKYGTEVDYPLNRILTAPSACVRDANGCLLSWALTHYDLSIGFVFTLPEYRKKQLAKACTQVLIERMKKFLSQLESELAIHCHIESSNQASIHLFQSLGFVSVSKVS